MSPRPRRHCDLRGARCRLRLDSTPDVSDRLAPARQVSGENRLEGLRPVELTRTDMYT